MNHGLLNACLNVEMVNIELNSLMFTLNSIPFYTVEKK